ncbi:macrolide transporter subunit MacA [Cupriavidus basilensis]|uniref:Macrolide-specific efflux protein MacA n=1 Tax=Cupriavidus basilensis TaxID=68895 RepID=A0A0C4YIB8_9BURK|nr:macrolide transporter subunit MacA [Cupriavidus basilensis]AJG22743.1 Macrolide-specific efflux protein MacA [Cupriavidus basilensis]
MAHPPNRRRHGLIIAVLTLSAIIALAAWRLTPGKHPEYITATVTRGDLEVTVLANGVLQPIRQVEVGAQVNGQLKSLKVKLGDKVKQGQLLAQIDPVLLENALRQANAAVASGKAQRDAKRSRLRQARLNWQRQRELQSQEAASRQDLEIAEADLRSLEAELLALDADIAQLSIKAESARIDLGYTRIVAPMDGEVVALTTLEGQTVVASYQVPTILKLANLDAMTVKAQVSEADVIRIADRQAVYFTIMGEPDRRYHASLQAIQPSPEKINNAVFFNALFDVPNPGRRLRIDMTAQVAIMLGEARNTLLVPLAALGPRGRDGSMEVRVLRPDQRVETVQVRTGLSNSAHAQVLSGLTQGDRVITGDAGVVNAETRP